MGSAGEDVLQFSLIFRGSLPACQVGESRLEEKQGIRLKFSHQLQMHWQHEPALWEPFRTGLFAEAKLEDRRLVMLGLQGSYAQCVVKAFNFDIYPLVCRFNGLGSHLDVDVFRRGDPGSILNHADIDNQLKTLFDALRMPLSVKELPGHLWGHGECLFTLLEDDSLIARLTVDAQRLTTPKEPDEPENYAEVTIKATIVKLKPHPGTQWSY